jgi:pimeloyl-ACP methyl ester carboxylesterase
LPLCALCALWVLCASSRAEEIQIRNALVIGQVARGGRSAVVVDPVQAMLVGGTWKAPAEGDELTGADGRPHKWRTIQANKDGAFEDDDALGGGGYAFVRVPSDRGRVMLLCAAGHAMVYVNGEPRVGDPYSNGIVDDLPVQLHKGDNELLFATGRGRLKMSLVDPPTELFISKLDPTLPDFIRGKADELPAAVLAVNATTRPVTLVASVSGGADFVQLVVAPISCRKLRLTVPYDGRDVETLPFDVTLRRGDERVATQHFDVQVRATGEAFDRTFVSGIDGSVQCFAVLARQRLPGDDSRGALVLSLHGADVVAINQAKSYAPKSWATIICPTNRRPFGFDWEDWGRLDALEVLNEATRLYQPDPSQIYLTGHSMGGHGTWQLGALFPDRFAAIGPSAGWISFASYVNARATTQPAATSSSALPTSSPVTTQSATLTIRDLLRRASLPSDTLAMIHNYASVGVYVLHGDADDNVPIAQARQMVAQLRPFHHDVTLREQPGAGHWWDADEQTAGVDCVDWAPMFDFFARHRLPRDDEVGQIDFTTPSPGVTSRCHWLTIESQTRQFQASNVSIRVNPPDRRIVGITDNVASLSIDLSRLPPTTQPSRATLDNDALELAPWQDPRPPLEVRTKAATTVSSRAYLERTNNHWRVIPPPAASLKNPTRSGPVKSAFDHHVLFVYGTQGTSDETNWALAKARYDAETFWYRGNGSIDLISDTKFDPADPRDHDRSVILYGNADTLRCWTALLSDSPVRVARHAVLIGRERIEADDLACVFVRPRPGSDIASVAVVGGTGLPGMRLTDRLPVFSSGVAFPDVFVADTTMLKSGLPGVRAAGFFGNDWTVESGEIVIEPKS